jgi:hypothetical protein
VDGKPLIKFNHFMIKTLMKLGIERMYLSITKAICDKHIANIILDREKLKQFPPWETDKEDWKRQINCSCPTHMHQNNTRKLLV